MNKISRKFRANCTSGGGFTLAELLIVVAVIAVLVAVAIPTFTNQLEKSRQAVDVSNLRGAYAAARLAEIDQAVGTERFKTVMEGFKANTANYKSGLQYWYDPDSGELTRLVDPDADANPQIIGVSSGGVISGKATGNKVVADTSQLPSIGDKIVYNRGSLNTGTKGTTDKGILVTYKSDVEKNDMYVIDKIVFVTSSGVWGVDAQVDGLYRATQVAGALTITSQEVTASGTSTDNTTLSADASGVDLTLASAWVIAGGNGNYKIVEAPANDTDKKIEFTLATDGSKITVTAKSGATIDATGTTYKAIVEDDLGTKGDLYFTVKVAKSS